LKTPLPAPQIILSLLDQQDNYDFLITVDGDLVHCTKKFTAHLAAQNNPTPHINSIFRNTPNGKWWLNNQTTLQLESNHPNSTRFSLHFLPLDEHFIYTKCQALSNKPLSADFLYDALNSLPSDLAIFDLEHRYLFLNPVAISNEETRTFLIGKTDFDYFNLKNLDDSVAHARHDVFTKALDSNNIQQWEDIYPQPDGSKKVIRRTFSPMKNEANELIGMLGYGLDISEAKMAQERAENNEKRFRSLFENNMAAVFRTNEYGEILEINQAYARIFGFDSIEELKQHKSSEFYPNGESRKKYIEQLREHGKLENYLIENTRKDGKKIQLLSNVLYTIEKGIGIIEGTLIDITEQQESLRLIEEKSVRLEQLAFFLDQTNDAIQVVNEQGQFVYLNKAARERLGIEWNEMESFSILDVESYFTSIDHWKAHIDDLEKIGVLHIESVNRNVKTGEETPVEVTVIPRTMNGERFAISTLRDISEKIAAQKILEEKNRFVKDLTSAVDASSLVSVTDESGKILRVNANFCRVSGFREDELIGQNHNIVNSGYHNKEFWGGLYHTLKSGEIWRGEIRNRAKDGGFYWVNTVIYPIKGDNDEGIQYMSIRQEVTSAKLNESIIQKQVNFQDLLIRTASKLLNLNPDELDHALNEALKDIGQFVNADRSYIFDYNHENRTTNNLYEWCREGIEPQIETLQNIPFSDVPKWIEVHFKGEIMEVKDVSILPDSQFKELLEVQDIKSLIAIPMMDNSQCTGFIGFDSVRSVHSFNETDKIILELFAEMVVNINKRIEFISQIEQANNRYIEINEGLERIVTDKTAKNNELTQSMANQDKLAMIGEITAGITHDLNTPIGAIKVGAESIQYTLESLFKSVLSKCTLDQLNVACSRTVENNVQMFVGGMQTLRETAAMTRYLNEHYPNFDQVDHLSSALVKARVKPEENEVINTIISSNNPLDFADLIYHIQSIRTFVNTVLEAGDKASNVIKNLRFYLKEGSQLVKGPVNLQENIRTVLNVFNHQLKYGVDLKFNIPETIELFGYEPKLYQLWSNLIKNAIEAMHGSGELRISAQETKRIIEVTISNSGDMIPVDIQEKIFDKFFTTKGETTGTGLGLSIVRNVVDEHNAKIILISDEQFTSFIVTFIKDIE
jgi:PAS domain S-box-containing protein